MRIWQDNDGVQTHINQVSMQAGAVWSAKGHGHIYTVVKIQYIYISHYDSHDHLTRGEINYLHAASRDVAALLLCWTDPVWVVVNNGDHIIVFWDDGGGAFVLMLLLHVCVRLIFKLFVCHCLVTHNKGGKSLSISKVKLTVTINEHVKYFYSSGVEKYPCEFWPALLLFCMMLCFEKNAS